MTVSSNHAIVNDSKVINIILPLQIRYSVRFPMNQIVICITCHAVGQVEVTIPRNVSSCKVHGLELVRSCETKVWVFSSDRLTN